MTESGVMTNRELFRGSIMEMQGRVNQIPGAVQGEDLDKMCPLKHSFAPGLYVREIFIPKGTIIVGKIHKHEHPNFLMSGEAIVRTEAGGDQVLKAPLSMISQAGTKRLIFAITDLVWITVHLNKEDTKDLKHLEDFIIAPSFEDFDNFKKLEAESPQKEITV